MLSPDYADALARWRARAVQRMPYFAPVLYRLVPVNAPGLGTMGVDFGWRVYIDFEHVIPLGDEWGGDTLLHEVGHIVGDHGRRTRDFMGDRYGSPRDRRIANVACDLAINGWFVPAGCHTLADVLPARFGLPADMTPEFYWRELVAHEIPRPESRCPECGQNQADQPGQSCPRCGADVPFRGCGPAGGGMDIPGRFAGAPGSPAPVEVAEQEAALVSTALAITEAAKTRGDVPGGLVVHAAALLVPSVVPWQRVLGVALRKAAASTRGQVDTSYAVRNRRRPFFETARGRARNAGLVKPDARIVVVRDTSASMSAGDLARVVSEVEGISRKMQVRGDDLRVVDADTRLYDVKGYRSSATLATVTGRGGTSMDVAIRDACRLKPRPNVVVCATDGYTPWPDRADCAGVPVIACVIGDAVNITVPDWIVTVRVPAVP